MQEKNKFAQNFDAAVSDLRKVIRIIGRIIVVIIVRIGIVRVVIVIMLIVVTTVIIVMSVIGLPSCIGARLMLHRGFPAPHPGDSLPVSDRFPAKTARAISNRIVTFRDWTRTVW